MTTKNETPEETQKDSPKSESLKNSTVLAGANAYPQRGVYEFMRNQSSAAGKTTQKNSTAK